VGSQSIFIYQLKFTNIKKRVAVTESLLHPYFYESPRPSMPEEIKILKKLDAFRKKTYEQPDKKIKKWEEKKILLKKKIKKGERNY